LLSLADKNILKGLSKLTTDEALLFTKLCQPQRQDELLKTATVPNKELDIDMKELAKRTIAIRTTRGYEKITPLFSEILISESDITVKWSMDIYKNLKMLQRYSFLIGVKYTYAIDLYNLLEETLIQTLVQNKEMVNVDLSISQIRKECGCESKYLTSPSQFRKKVIDSAISDLQERLNRSIDYAFVKNGKEVSSLRFTISI